MKKPYQYSKNSSSEKEIIIDESWENILYQSDFRKNLTLLVENFLHKKLNINYIQ
jgi:hypothetical protein